ncbi:cobalamin B12-binding domain-containing protein [Kitasatospora sp. NPDC018058]|uniref:cobalamin B12-binding domain-containing protein n=1 Tax=Kitasatospora sp. NPDC018058 TaxID=3364025 RepID=UPI0037C140E2
MQPNPAPLRVLVSGTSSDAHTWNLIFLQLTLEEAGHRVDNLGPCVPDRLLVDTCLERRPDVLLLSSVNGHGHSDIARAVAALRREPRLAATSVLAGGLLGTDGGPNSRYAPTLLAAGVDAVLEPDQLAELHRWLSERAARRALYEAAA